MTDLRWAFEREGFANVETVVASGNRVLAGADVHGGGRTVQSDARGRFRVTGLPTGVPLTLTISHPQKRAKTFVGVKAHPSAALIGRTFRLTGQPVPDRRLSSLQGDVLPPPGSAPITTEAQTGAPPAGDVLRLVNHYANGDGRAVSMFMDFAQGRFILRTYRLPKAALPAGLVLKDWLEQDAAGVWTKARASRRRLRRRQRLAAVKRAHAGQPISNALMDQAVTEVLAAASDVKGR